MKLFLGIVLSLAVASCTAPAPTTSAAVAAIYGPCDTPIPPSPNCLPFDDSYCDPATNADLGPIQYTCQQYVPCSDGIIMYAYATPDCRFCIPLNVCAGHDGPGFPQE